MLLDQNAMMSDKQAVTATAASANVIDLGAAGNAAPGALFAVCRVDEAFAGVSQLKVSLQTDDTEAFSAAEELLSATFETGDLGEVKTLFALACPGHAQRRQTLPACLLHRNGFRFGRQALVLPDRCGGYEVARWVQFNGRAVKCLGADFNLPQGTNGPSAYGCSSQSVRQYKQ